jgi:type IV secretory pathway component VirB8
VTISSENRAQFEIMGTAGVRSDMAMGNYIKVKDTLSQAHEWLKEQDANAERRETRRFWAMIILTALAMIASAIAAWPVVKEWLPKAVGPGLD